MIAKMDPELKKLLKKGGCGGRAMVPFVSSKLEGSPREQYRQLTMRTGKRPVPWELIWKVVVILLLVKSAWGQSPAKASLLAPVYGEGKLVPLSVDLTGALRVSGGGGGGGGLTDAQLRASPVPMSLSTIPLAPDAATETTLGLIYGRLPTLVTGRIPVDGSGVTQPISGSVTVSNFPGTQPVSGTVTANAGTGTMNVACVSGCAGATEVATYTWTVPDVVAGANKLFLDLFNASGSGKLVKIRGIYPIMKTDVAVTGALAIRWDLFRTSAVGTAGTTAVYKSATRDVAGGSIVPADTNSADLPAQITGRHLPTGGATAASWVRRFGCFTEETNAATYICSGQTNFLEMVTGGQPFVLREGQGILLQQGSIATLNNIAFTIVFSVE